MGKIELIKPGLIVNVILYPYDGEGFSDIRGSIVHDASDRDIIISQTEPPISEKKRGEEAALTFVVREITGKTRYRIFVRIEEFIKSYRLTSQEKIQVIRLLRISNPEIYNIRMSYRVELPLKNDLKFFINRHGVNLIDISIGGAKISHNMNLDLNTGDIINVAIIIDRRVYEVDAQVLRIWDPPDQRFKQTLQFMAMKFLNMPVNIQNILSRKLMEIQRDIRYRELFEL